MGFFKDVIILYAGRWRWFLELLEEHILLTAAAVAVSGVLGLLIGIWISGRRRLAPTIIGICNVLYTIPAISLLGILIPFLGIGNRTAVTALVIYGMMPMVRNTYTGITNVDRDIIEAAVAMGSTKRQLLLRIKLPMALSVILTGLRSMVVMTISVGGIASFIGAGGLGVAIYRGITIYNPAMTFAGGLLIALTAIIADLLLGMAEKRYKTKRRMK